MCLFNRSPCSAIQHNTTKTKQAIFGMEKLSNSHIWKIKFLFLHTIAVQDCTTCAQVISQNVIFFISCLCEDKARSSWKPYLLKPSYYADHQVSMLCFVFFFFQHPRVQEFISWLTIMKLTFKKNRKTLCCPQECNEKPNSLTASVW